MSDDKKKSDDKPKYDENFGLVIGGAALFGILACAWIIVDRPGWGIWHGVNRYRTIGGLVLGTVSGAFSGYAYDAGADKNIAKPSTYTGAAIGLTVSGLLLGYHYKFIAPTVYKTESMPMHAPQWLIDRMNDRMKSS